MADVPDRVLELRRAVRGSFSAGELHQSVGFLRRAAFGPRSLNREPAAASCIGRAGKSGAENLARRNPSSDWPRGTDTHPQRKGAGSLLRNGNRRSWAPRGCNPGQSHGALRLRCVTTAPVWTNRFYKKIFAGRAAPPCEDWIFRFRSRSDNQRFDRRAGYWISIGSPVNSFHARFWSSESRAWTLAMFSF